METKEDTVLSAKTREKLQVGVAALVDELRGYVDLDGSNFDHTAKRVVRMYEELFEGVKQDPAKLLQVHFPAQHYDELITVCNIDFVSMCAHHLLPFVGYAHFAYLPDEGVVGLSKIPRMIRALARRPQIQEKLTQDIVNLFQRVVRPHGCAVLVDAWHSCVAVRGVREPRAMMRTTALAGSFQLNPSLKREFFDTIALEVRRF